MEYDFSSKTQIWPLFFHFLLFLFSILDFILFLKEKKSKSKPRKFLIYLTRQYFFEKNTLDQSNNYNYFNFFVNFHIFLISNRQIPKKIILILYIIYNL